MKKLLYITCLLGGTLASPSAFGQERMYVTNGKDIYIGNELALTLGGGALVAADTLSYNDTLYVRGGALSGYYKLKRLVVDGGSTVTIDSAASDITEVMVTGGVKVNGNSTLAANSQLTLLSTASATASVEQLASGNSVTGGVTVQRYVPGGRRAYRFMGHPFTSSLKLSTTLMDDIDITGTGGASNGFTTTQSNEQSCMWYFPGSGDTNVATKNPGWIYYTTTLTENWQRYQGINVMVRGTKGQGLQGQAYTPSPVTIDMTGLINQGDQTINVYTNSSGSAGFNVIANPYPSHVNLKTPLNNMANKRGSTYWVWNTQMGTKGAYESVLYGNDFWLPSSSAFCVDVTAASSITFQESDKVDTGRKLFRVALPESIELKVFSDDRKMYWDKMMVVFNEEATDKAEQLDGLKKFSGEADMYSLSDDSTALSLNAMPFIDNKITPLGFVSEYEKKYEIVVTDYTLDASKVVYLYDKYLGVKTLLQPDAAYEFQVTKDPLSSGGRFQLGYQTKVVDIASSNTTWKLYPNPVATGLTVQASSTLLAEAKIVVTDMQGRIMYNGYMNAGNQQFVVEVDGWTAGVYFVNIIGEGQRNQTLKFVKL